MQIVFLNQGDRSELFNSNDVTTMKKLFTIFVPYAVLYPQAEGHE